MELLYGTSALFFGGSSILLFFQQLFLISLIAFALAVVFVYLFEIS